MSKLDQLKALREAKSSRGSFGSLPDTPNGVVQSRTASLDMPGPRENKLGRPLDVDKAKTLTATKPWAAAGMSRRTWYRRRAEKRAT